MALEGPNPGLSADDQESVDFVTAALEVCIHESRLQELRLRQIAAPLVLLEDLPLQTPVRVAQYALDAQLATENLVDARRRILRFAEMQNSQPPQDDRSADETGL